jgi:hypothetical protein
MTQDCCTEFPVALPARAFLTNVRSRARLLSSEYAEVAAIPARINDFSWQKNAGTMIKAKVGGQIMMGSSRMAEQMFTHPSLHQESLSEYPQIYYFLNKNRLTLP